MLYSSVVVSFSVLFSLLSACWGFSAKPFKKEHVTVLKTKHSDYTSVYRHMHWWHLSTHHAFDKLCNLAYIKNVLQANWLLLQQTQILVMKDWFFLHQTKVRSIKKQLFEVSNLIYLSFLLPITEKTQSFTDKQSFSRLHCMVKDGMSKDG